VVVGEMFAGGAVIEIILSLNDISRIRLYFFVPHPVQYYPHNSSSSPSLSNCHFSVPRAFRRTTAFLHFTVTELRFIPQQDTPPDAALLRHKPKNGRICMSRRNRCESGSGAA
jgi:hypothetical protein